MIRTQLDFNSNVRICEVKNRNLLKRFIHLPSQIHKGHKNWLPNLFIDEWKFFDSRKNHAFSFTKSILLLAYKGNKIVGRIMGIIPEKYNQINSQSTARWGYLECYDDFQVAEALLLSIEQWAKAHQIKKIIGPYGFSDKDPQGLLIEGFQHPPLILSACNFPYLVNLVEKAGYQKEIDCYVYKYDVRNQIPEVYSRIFERVRANNKYKLIEFTSKKQIKPYIIPVLQLMNQTYSKIYGFVPLDQKEMTQFASRYMPVLDPKFIKLIEKNGEIIAFIIAIPNLTKGIQKSKGWLFPCGIWHIIRETRITKQLDLMLGAVHPDFQGMGVEVLMTVSLLKSAENSRFNTIEVHLMLETNKAVLGEMKRANASHHKTFRIYQKSLS